MREVATPFQALTLQETLDDLAARFIINVPEEELATVERILFQIELAFWYYEDIVRPLSAQAPQFSLKIFSARLFNHHPLLRQWAHTHESAYKDWIEYKIRVPVCGAVLLNSTMDKVLLVRGAGKSRSWGFPKGKINKSESTSECAIREVNEETGFDCSRLLREEDFVELTVREQRVRLYIVVGVPEDCQFAPLTKGEISAISWHRLFSLPTSTSSEQSSIPSRGDISSDTASTRRKDFFLVAPFVKHVKQWVARKQAVRGESGRRHGAHAVSPTRHVHSHLQPPAYRHPAAPGAETPGSASDDERTERGSVAPNATTRRRPARRNVAPVASTQPSEDDSDLPRAPVANRIAAAVAARKASVSPARSSGAVSRGSAEGKPSKGKVAAARDLHDGKSRTSASATREKIKRPSSVPAEEPVDVSVQGVLAQHHSSSTVFGDASNAPVPVPSLIPIDSLAALKARLGISTGSSNLPQPTAPKHMHTTHVSNVASGGQSNIIQPSYATPTATAVDADAAGKRLMAMLGLGNGTNSKSSAAAQERPSEPKGADHGERDRAKDLLAMLRAAAKVEVESSSALRPTQNENVGTTDERSSREVKTPDDFSYATSPARPVRLSPATDVRKMPLQPRAARHPHLRRALVPYDFVEHQPSPAIASAGQKLNSDSLAPSNPVTKAPPTAPAVKHKPRHPTSAAAESVLTALLGPRAAITAPPAPPLVPFLSAFGSGGTSTGKGKGRAVLKAVGEERDGMRQDLLGLLMRGPSSEMNPATESQPVEDNFADAEEVPVASNSLTPLVKGSYDGDVVMPEPLWPAEDVVEHTLQKETTEEIGAQDDGEPLIMFAGELVQPVEADLDAGETAHAATSAVDGMTEVEKLVAGVEDDEIQQGSDATADEAEAEREGEAMRFPDDASVVASSLAVEIDADHVVLLDRFAVAGPDDGTDQASVVLTESAHDGHRADEATLEVENVNAEGQEINEEQRVETDTTMTDYGEVVIDALDEQKDVRHTVESEATGGPVSSPLIQRSSDVGEPEQDVKTTDQRPSPNASPVTTTQVATALSSQPMISMGSPHATSMSQTLQTLKHTPELAPAPSPTPLMAMLLNAQKKSRSPDVGTTPTVQPHLPPNPPMSPLALLGSRHPTPTPTADLTSPPFVGPLSEQPQPIQSQQRLTRPATGGAALLDLFSKKDASNSKTGGVSIGTGSVSAGFPVLGRGTAPKPGALEGMFGLGAAGTAQTSFGVGATPRTHSPNVLALFGSGASGIGNRQSRSEVLERAATGATPAIGSAQTSTDAGATLLQDLLSGGAVGSKSGNGFGKFNSPSSPSGLEGGYTQTASEDTRKAQTISGDLLGLLRGPGSGSGEK
ncbi:mRNA-decapping enzyme subunit 2 [Gonapodya sp. JEL0774]|nr:mRNA-decapping enzyme subunit 2 [Gonapodya sp. JEL0774]